MTVRIGNGAGFLGDNLDAPRELAQSCQLEYLTLEYLAELTLSILARLREKDPAAGYAADFLTVLESLVLVLAQQPRLKIITNGGGVNPQACARAAGAILGRAGMGNLLIGVVSGDDLRPQLDELQRQGCTLANLETRQPLAELKSPVVSANAYLGARPIVEALAAEARIVITGRVADASLTLAPAVHEFGWSWNDWNRLAAGSVAGHLIECGAQVTGGFYTHGNEVDLAHVGYPIAELSADGGCVITKPMGSGGRVDFETVSEQLIYEIADPAHYLTPDVDVDFTTVELHDEGGDRVRVSGASGRPATGSYKVSLAYRAGYTATSQLLIYGDDCIAKAQTCAAIVWEKLRAAGVELEQTHAELLGSGVGVPGLAEPPPGIREVVLRLSVRDSRAEAVERFTRELVPLATSGPAGLAGYTAARGTVRPVFAYWPTLVSKSLVKPEVDVRSADAWATHGVAAR